MCNLLFATCAEHTEGQSGQTEGRLCIRILFICDEIVQEYTEEYKEKQKKTNEQRIGLRHT